MHTHRLGLAAVLALSVGSGAMAQMTTASTTQSVAAGAVGRWLYDAQGNIIGSVRALADKGQTAVLMIGSYFQLGSHEARVPARALSLVNGKVTLRAETVQALARAGGWPRPE